MDAVSEQLESEMPNSEPLTAADKDMIESIIVQQLQDFEEQKAQQGAIDLAKANSMVAPMAISLTDSKVVRIYNENLALAHQIKIIYDDIKATEGIVEAQAYRLLFFMS